MKQTWQWIKDNDVIQRIFALLLAIFLWAFVMLEDDSDIRDTLDNMPVRLEGVSVLNANDLVILSGANTLVDVDISGPRSQVNTVQNDYKNLLSAYTYVDNITEPGEYELEFRVDPTGTGYPDVKVTATKPKTITVVVDRMSSTSVPVDVELIGEMGSGYSLSEYSVSPDAIIVRGPETILRQIKTAKVVYDVSGLTASMQTNVTYTLLDANNQEVTNTYLSADTPSTTLDLSLRQQDVIELTVGLKDSPYLKSYMVETDIQPQGIKLTGDPEVIREINSISLEDIDLAEVLEEGTMEFVRMIRLPDGVSLANGEVQIARVTITLKNCGWETVELDQTNLPEDALLTYPDQSFSIEVFGSNTSLARLRESDILLEPIYELEDLVVGDNVLPCRITLEDEGIYVKQQLEVTVHVTQEALDAALNPDPVAPDQPNQ